MKKIVLSTILALSFLISAFPGLAEELPLTTATIFMQEGTNNILQYNNAYFFIDYDKNLESGVYKTEIILDGKTYKEVSANVVKGRRLTIKIDLPLLQKGMHTIKLIINGEETPQGEVSFAAVELYKKQPGDEYSRIGINTHIKSSQDILTLSLGGVKNMRQTMYWSSMEQEKGVYSAADYQYIKNAFEKCDTTCLFESAFGNTLYVNDIPDAKWNTPPRTREQIDAYAEYVVETLKSFPEIRKVEIWNEPNLASASRAANMTSIEYVQLMKRTAMAIKEYDPTIIIMGGALANQKSIEFTEDMLELGAADFIDGISIHPYCYPNNPDERFIEKAAPNWQPPYEYGGWLEMYATEMGYPNHINAAGVTEEKSAVYFPKMYVLGDYAGYGELYWHNGVNNGWDAYDREDNFGILRTDYTPKPAFASMSQVCKVLNNARYIGMYHPTEGLNAYCYIKENKPLMVCWAPEGEVSYNFGNTAVVEDLWGNRISTELKIGEEPVYVYNISAECLYLAARSMSIEGYTTFLEKWQEPVVYNFLSQIKSRKKLSAYEMISANYAAGLELISNFNKEKEKIEDLTQKLYKLHEIGEKLASFYASTGPKIQKVSAEKNLAQINDVLLAIKQNDENASVRFTERMTKLALVAIERGKSILSDKRNNSIASYVAADNLMARFLLEWANELVKIEECNYYSGLLTYMYPAKLSTFLGRENTVELSIDNRTNKDINGHICWYDDHGNQIGESISISVKKGVADEYTLPVNIGMDAELGNHIYEARIISDGRTIARQWLDVSVSSAATVSIEPAVQTFSGLRKIQVNVKNSYDEKINGTLKVTAPDGWVLATEEQKIVVKDGGTLPVEFDISQKTQTAYNEYVFHISLENSDGAILADEYLPLDFLVATKTETELDVAEFDGNISQWSNAYPIHIGVPDKAHIREEWYKSNRSARAYAKYDDKNFYMLIDVYDDYSSQFYSEYDMWRGDSIQVSFDTLNDDAQTYQDDDFEYGFSYTSSGNSVYAYQAGNDESGNRDGEYLSIIRDGNKKITRYMIKLPKSMLGELKLQSGYLYGFNICVNDADVLERDAYIQFTTGTGNKKLPADYRTFRFVEEDVGVEANDDMLTTQITKTQYFDY